MNLNKIKLIELTTKDYSDRYLQWMNDLRITKFTEQKYIKHKKRDIINFINKKKKSNTEFLYGIFFVENKNKIHLGNIKIGPINKIHLTAPISYFLGETKYHGQGIVSVAIKKIIKIAKYKFKLKKLYAGFYKDNIGSKKVLKKNNFVFEGKFKSQLKIGKKRTDHIFYGLLL
jgi:RimJ/RimL family protein N-acetyltransferase